jgi:hypothetical protein
VHYQARTPDNLNAKDELYLTPKEARALGPHRVKPLNPTNIVTALPGDIPAVQSPAIGPAVAPKSRPDLSTLINEVSLCDTSAKLAVCRRKIISMGIFTSAVPYSKSGIINALLALNNVG